MAPHNRFNHRWGKRTKTGWLQLLVDMQAMRRLSGPSRQQTDEQTQGSRMIPSELSSELMILSDVSNSYHFDSSSPGAMKGDPSSAPLCLRCLAEPQYHLGGHYKGLHKQFLPLITYCYGFGSLLHTTARVPAVQLFR